MKNVFPLGVKAKVNKLENASPLKMIDLYGENMV